MLDPLDELNSKQPLDPLLKKYSWCVIIIVISWTIQHRGHCHWCWLLLGHVWLIVAQWFWGRRFFNFIDEFLQFFYYLRLKKGVALCLYKLEFPSPKDALCQVWLKSAGWYWGRRWKCEKFANKQTNGRTDRRRTTGDQKSSLEFSAQMS